MHRPKEWMRDTSFGIVRPDPGSYSVTVQRLFSLFPGGWAGVALLLLRASVSATLIVDGAVRSSPGTSSWVLAGIIVPVFLLLPGLLTPYVCVASCLFQLGVMFFRGELSTGGEHGFHLLVSALNTAILAFLGPGAYSIDARVFGRRILKLPPIGGGRH
jgi:uncharacterized membrane protein YphA (DoxX/SURF4 family)